MLIYEAPDTFDSFITGNILIYITPLLYFTQFTEFLPVRLKDMSRNI